jgi:thiamine biosynthesis protein ThiS
MEVEMAKIVANGKECQVQLPCSVGEYVRRCGWRPTQVVVEHNGKVVGRSTLDDVQLADRDQIEVILPVAGG